MRGIETEDGWFEIAFCDHDRPVDPDPEFPSAPAFYEDFYECPDLVRPGEKYAFEGREDRFLVKYTVEIRGADKSGTFYSDFEAHGTWVPADIDDPDLRFLPEDERRQIMERSNDAPTH